MISRVLYCRLNPSHVRGVKSRQRDWIDALKGSEVSAEQIGLGWIWCA
jgi:hypothetical protein